MTVRRVDILLLGAAACMGAAAGTIQRAAPAGEAAKRVGRPAAPAATGQGGSGPDGGGHDGDGPGGAGPGGAGPGGAGPGGAGPGGAEGADAEAPSDIPARGWWQIAKRAGSKFLDDGLLAQAAAVTFYSLLALFPGLAALVSLYGLFAAPQTIEKTVGMLSSVLPGGGMDIITGQIHALVSKPPAALGLGLLVGLATSLWSANAGIKAMFDALNVAYEEREKRSFVRRTLISFAFTLGMLVFVIVAVTGAVALPVVMARIGVAQSSQTVLAIARWPALLAVVILFLAVLYRYGPSRRVAQWRWVTWGSAFAAVAWVVMSLLFSFYVDHFGNYNATYGTLGAAVGFMTWMWLSGSVVLFGAELNAEMEHQIRRDTTVGAPRPIGARGAVKADTVATA